jgi:hypothetical protein
MHAALQRAIDAKTRHDAVDVLLGAWRVDRTSELADAIALLDELVLGEPLRDTVRRALDSFDIAEEDRLPVWEKLTEYAATLLPLPPDPRIGRAIERMLLGPQEYMFRADQVAHHVVGRFPQTDSATSFADHAFALIERNADRGTAQRLEKLANVVYNDGDWDCNGVEVVERLRALAASLAFGPDTMLSDEARSLLEALDARHTR